MAYIEKIGLNPIPTVVSGRNSIEFIEFTCKYDNDKIVYITPYYNSVVGTYDITRTQLYFENNTILINQSYAISTGELI
jgi:hypothetical protein